jgi:flagellar basal-body rod modification protein FlgD
MAANTISPVSTYSENTSTESRIPQRTLGQEDFLKLLTVQMTQQDPLNPKSDMDFIAQMAQFTSLEQARATQTGMAVLQANSLLGRTVTIDASGQTVVGVVSAVHIEEGMPRLVVGGQRYELKQVLGIEPAPTAATPAPKLQTPTPKNALAPA